MVRSPAGLKLACSNPITNPDLQPHPNIYTNPTAALCGWDMLRSHKLLCCVPLLVSNRLCKASSHLVNTSPSWGECMGQSHCFYSNAQPD